jgi:hypothetical protein
MSYCLLLLRPFSYLRDLVLVFAETEEDVFHPFFGSILMRDGAIFIPFSLYAWYILTIACSYVNSPLHTLESQKTILTLSCKSCRVYRVLRFCSTLLLHMLINHMRRDWVGCPSSCGFFPRRMPLCGSFTSIWSS